MEKLHLPPDFHVVVSKMSFPKTIDFGKVYRLLEFDKKEQINELEQIAKEVKVKDLKVKFESLLIAKLPFDSLKCLSFIYVFSLIF